MPREPAPHKLGDVKRNATCLLVAFGFLGGCGDANSGVGTGGSGGTPPAEQSSYSLSCPIDTLVLEVDIELSYELDQPYVAGGSSELAFSAAVTFSELAAATLIDAGIDKVDIISMQIATSLEGATPALVETSFAVPINDLDLRVDTDDNGLPGPHRLELETVVATTTVIPGASQVELGLRTDQVSLVLGDFEVPDDCLSPTLVGFNARFAVGSSG